MHSELKQFDNLSKRMCVGIAMSVV